MIYWHKLKLLLQGIDTPEGEATLSSVFVSLSDKGKEKNLL